MTTLPAPVASLPSPRRRLGALCLALTAFGLLGAPARAADPGISADQVLIGQAISLQDGRNDYAAAVQSGVRLLLDQVNREGGVQGRRLVLRTLDDQGRNDQAEAHAQRLVADGVFLLFGSLEGGPSSAVARVATARGVPFVGPMAGAPGLRRPHQAMVYPVRAEHREEFRAMMVWGRSVGLRTIGLLHADTDVGRQHLENVRRLASELGMEVVLPLPFPGGELGDAQVGALVERIARAQPDLLFNHGSASLYARLLRDARTAGLRTTFTGVNSGSTQIARALGDAGQGMMFAQVVPSPWERKREITREYQDAARRQDPAATFSYGALEGYMSAKLLVMALRRAGRDLSRASLHRALEHPEGFDLGGIVVRYRPGDHEGARFVDLSMVSRDGRFIH